MLQPARAVGCRDSKKRYTTAR